MVFSQLVRAFCVAGAILWKRVKATVSFFRGCAFYSFVAGAHFVTWRRKYRKYQKSWQGQHFVMRLNKWPKHRKKHIFGAL